MVGLSEAVVLSEKVRDSEGDLVRLSDNSLVGDLVRLKVAVPERVGVRVMTNSGVKVIEISSEKVLVVESVGLTEMLRVSVGVFDKLVVRDSDRLPLRLRSSLSESVSDGVKERDALSSEVGLLDKELVSEYVSVPVLLLLERVGEREGLSVQVNRLLLRDWRWRRSRVRVGGRVLDSESDTEAEGSSDSERVGVIEISETVTESEVVGETVLELLYDVMVLSRVRPDLVRERDFSLLSDLDREMDGVRPDRVIEPFVEESEKLAVLDADSSSVSENVMVSEELGDKVAVNPVGVSVNTVGLSVNEAGVPVNVIENVSVMVSEGSVRDRVRVFSSLKECERVAVSSSDGDSDRLGVRE